METENKMPFALTVAGFDGSGGAGILADIKAFDSFGVYGQAVCTANTIQNESDFIAPGFLPWISILAQLNALYRKRSFDFVKIGLIPSAEILKNVVLYIREYSPNAFIIWDPIISATAGYKFFTPQDMDSFIPWLNQINLITPNQKEFTYLGLGLAASRNDVKIGSDFAVLLKGGHQKGDFSTDTLWYEDQQIKFSSKRLSGKGKHGTGCTLSAAILANLALGYSLVESCQIAKNYMDLFLRGGEGLLGRV